VAAAAPLCLAAVPRFAAGAARGRPLALVTADLQSHVAVVDVPSGRIRARVATLPGPRSIERVDPWTALVGHVDEGALSLVDVRAGDAVRVVRGLGAPRYTSVAPHGRLAYVTDSARGELVVVDVRRARLVRRLDLGGPARHVTISPDGRWVWAVLGNSASEVAVVDALDPGRPRLARRLSPPFPAHDVVMSPGGRRVWVTSGDRGSVAVYDAARREVLRVLDADRAPQHVAFGRRVAYVTSGDDGLLRVHAQDDGRLLRTVAIPAGSYNVCAAAGAVVTPSLGLGTLWVLDASARPTDRLQVARAAHDVCLLGP
jgi:sugar lactone lactonase YvrE